MATADKVENKKQAQDKQSARPQTEAQVLTQISKYLSFVLRHNPKAANITLDQEGWTSIDILIRQANKTSGAIRKLGFNRDLLDKVVATDSKKRYSVSSDGKKIRAAQGHSTQEVDITFQPKEPPTILYHGTGRKSEEAIMAEGLKPMSRQYVHLSASLETAVDVGSRHGKPAVFVIQAQKLHQDGHQFFLSDNDVWLTKSIAPEHLTKMVGDPAAIAARQKERTHK
jgi:putative RNA 2'-phosphotransferase